MIGKTLSHFKITAKLGEGGMGEVYRAEDTKLGREVAIKVLPEAVANDPERLGRFEREAKVLAALNHPNIAAIYSLEAAGLRAGRSDVDGGNSAGTEAGRFRDGSTINFLVMELAEGEDLAERITRGPVAVEEAQAIALQISEALEAAHERGIIHRDLKPANIKVDSEGHVKVLDFGLAKALDPTAGAEAGRFDGATGAESDQVDASERPSVIPLSMSPTLTQQMTGAGVILGTASYMSPEQARGKAADKRADIWSFGVVLHEMLVGRKLFEAESVAETLGAIFQQDIDLDELPAITPRRLRRLLERCLDRDPKQRLRDIGEARIALDAIAAGDAEPEARIADSNSRRSGLSPLLFAVALLAVAAGATWIGMRINSAPDAPTLQVTEFAFEVEGHQASDISSDGLRFAWTDGSMVFVREFDDRQPRQVLEAEGIRDLFWSPDSSELALDLDEQLWRLDLATGTRELICDLPDLPKVPRAFILNGIWQSDGTILFALWRGGIYRVSSRGGAPEAFIPIDPEEDVDFHRIVMLPDSESLLLAAHYQESVSAGRDSTMAIERFRDGERSVVELPDRFHNMAPIGYLQNRLVLMQLGETDRQLWGLPFDPSTARLSDGEPELLISSLDFALVASNGTLAFMPRSEVPKVVVKIDETGQELTRYGESRNLLQFPALSPDGSRLATVVDLFELWVHDLERDTQTRLIEDEDFIVDPQWTSDSRTLYYSLGNTSVLRRVQADPGAEAETVHEAAYRSFLAPDDSGLLINRGGFQLQESGGFFWYPLDYKQQLSEEREIVPGFGISGRLSPNSRLLAYRLADEGQPEAYLTTFPDSDQTLQLSSGGAGTPRWSRDGTTVYYQSRGHVVEVEVGFDDNGRLRASPEKSLLNLQQAGLERAGWDVTPDGFLFVKALETDVEPELVVRQNALQPSSTH